MADKGQIITQIHYEKEQRYLKVLQEAFRRSEIQQEEVIAELKSIGFSADRAAIIFKQWATTAQELNPESKTTTSRRQKEMVSLKKYFFRKRKIRKWNDETKKWVTVVSEEAVN